MSIDTQIAAAVRQPRKRPAPSQRDQQIYLDYQTSGKLQSELAEQYKLTQCRISQIIRRVEKWLHAAPDELSETDDPAARQRLRSSLQFELLTTAARHALQHFKQPQKTVTHKKGTRGGKEIDETTERLLPANIQCLKVVLQANNQLSRLEKQGGTGVSPVRGRADNEESSDSRTAADQGREQVEAWLTEQRELVQPTVLTSRGCDSQTVVHDLVSALLGQAIDGWGLLTLADECGKKVVDRKSYDDNPPHVPPHDGWYYPMHDAHGKLVAWLSADQLAGAISPDYQPMSRAPVEPAIHVKGASPGGSTPGSDVSTSQSAISTPQSDQNGGSPEAAPKANSTTSPPTDDSSQPPCGPALTSQTAFGNLTLNNPGLSAV